MHRKADEEAIPVGMDDEDNAARRHLGPADLGELPVVTTGRRRRADTQRRRRTGIRCREPRRSPVLDVRRPAGK